MKQFTKYSSKQLESFLKNKKFKKPEAVQIAKLLMSRGFLDKQELTIKPTDIVNFYPSKNSKYDSLTQLTGKVTAVTYLEDGNIYARIAVKTKGYFYKQLNTLTLCKE